MITQHLKQSNNDIRIESAESVEDAKNNNFIKGEYVRYFINGKQVQSYAAMIKFIIEETKKNGEKFSADKNELKKIRRQMIQNQTDSLKKHLNELKRQYINMGISENALTDINKMIEKIDERGIRINE